MKLLFFSRDPPHHKNLTGIKLMCEASNITFEFTNRHNRIFILDYDILISNDTYFNPNSLPKNIKIIYGPQISTFPSGDICGPLDNGNKSRCCYNVLSSWVQEVFESMNGNQYRVPLKQLPFAVDNTKFKPDTNLEKEYDIDDVETAISKIK